MNVTIFKSVFDKENPHVITLQTALSRIQDGKSCTTIEEVRKGDKDKKKGLPVVCFSGEFSSRADDALFEHSGFIVLDFDHVDVDQTKRSLATDDFIHSCWTSPSGNGVKALVKITNPERHRDHFRALVKYFEKQHGLEVDESGVSNLVHATSLMTQTSSSKMISKSLGRLRQSTQRHRRQRMRLTITQTTSD